MLRCSARKLLTKPVKRREIVSVVVVVIILNSRFARMLTGFQTPTGPADIFFSWQWRTAVVDPIGLGMLNVADHDQSRRYCQT